MRLTLQLCRPTAVAPSPRVLRVAAMFGLGLDETRSLTIVPPTTLDLRAKQIVFLTGPSGGGKSSLLRLIAEGAAAEPDVRVIDFNHLPSPADEPIVNALFPHDEGEPALADALKHLSIAGLADAFVLLRKPTELSDGQRYRLRLAQAMEAVASSDAALNIILADEFAATLNRTTAHVIACNLRKWVNRCEKPVCFIAATTHDDLLEPLAPDVVIEKGLGSAIAIGTKAHALPGGPTEATPC